ncbi:MAG: hypothetical protein PF505_13300 [Vallitaleaceae bacterium]|jgi:hypothetical protein|nr:hypothetical protein [Vallitaleaceae bacterium]
MATVFLIIKGYQRLSKVMNDIEYDESQNRSKNTKQIEHQQLSSCEMCGNVSKTMTATKNINGLSITELA